MELREVKREPMITKYMFAKASQAGIPLSGTFELSPICNFTCRMCYVRKTRKEVEQSPRPMMTCEQWLDLAKQLKEEGMLYLLLTGGEPFLWPDFWKLYTELTKMGFLISINTNGSLINDEVVERLKKMPPTRINITLYGASDETYEALCQTKGVFSKVDRAITALQDAGITVKLNCSLTPENVRDLEKIVDYAQQKKLIVEVAAYMFPPLRRDESMVGKNERFTPQEAAFYNMKRYRLQYGEETYYRYLEKVAAGTAFPPVLDESCVDPVDGKLKCRAAKSAFWITWDGWLTPCGMMTQPKIDVTVGAFKDNWNRLIEVGNNIRLTGICESCESRQMCHFCAAVALAETGSFSGVPQYLCEEVRETKKIAEKELAERKNSGIPDFIKAY